MHSGFALAFMAVCIASMSRVSAQVAPSGPISRAATRAASELARESNFPTDDLQVRTTAKSDWSRVRRLEPGTEIMLAVDGAAPARRSFVTADDTNLIVLNLTDSSLPPAAVRMLRTMATENPPEYFLTPKHTFVDHDVRIGPDGLFVANRKIANLGVVVERIPRTEVATVALPVKNRGSLIGAGIGTAVGVVLGFKISISTLDCPYAGNCLAWQLRRTALLWAPVAVGVLGYQGAQHTVGGVIYRAPTPLALRDVCR